MRLAALVMFTMICLPAVRAPAADDLRCEALLLDCTTARNKLEDGLQQCDSDLISTKQVMANLGEELLELRAFMDELREANANQRGRINDLRLELAQVRKLWQEDNELWQRDRAWLVLCACIIGIAFAAYLFVIAIGPLLELWRWLYSGLSKIVRSIAIVPARIRSWWRYKRGRYEEIPMTVRFGGRDMHVSQFQQECINPDSVAEPMRSGDYPKCMFGIYCVSPEFPDTIYFKGYGFWAKFGKVTPGGVFVTAGHVTYDQGQIELVNMNDPTKRVRTSSSRWCHLNEYDVAIALPKQKVTQKLGLAMANIPNDLLVNRTQVQVYGNGVRTMGMVEPDRSISMVKYNGTTMPGFSGSPYMCNNVAIAVHIGSTASVAFGCDLHYLMMIMKRHARNLDVQADKYFDDQLPYEINPSPISMEFEENPFKDSELNIRKEGLGKKEKEPRKPMQLGSGEWIRPAVNTHAEVYEQAETLEEFERPEWYPDKANYIIIVSKKDPYAEYLFVREGINRGGGKRSRGARSWTTPEWLEHESERLARRGCKMDIYRTGYDDYFVRYMGNSYDLDRADADKLVQAGGAAYVSQDIQFGWNAWQGFHKESYWDPAVSKRHTILSHYIKPESVEFEYKHEPNGSSSIQLSKNGQPLSIGRPRVIHPMERISNSALAPVLGSIPEHVGVQNPSSITRSKPSTSSMSSKTTLSGHTSTPAPRSEVSQDMLLFLNDLDLRLKNLHAFMCKLYIQQLPGRSRKRGARKPLQKERSGSMPDLRMH